MRGVSPSQTLPIAGGQPPTPPGSVSPLHHDQRPALDPLIHRAGIHKTSLQTSSSRRRPGPTRRPIAVSCTKPHVPGHNHRRELQAQTIAAAIQTAQGQPRRRQTRAALHGSFLTRSGPPLTVREHQHQPDQHTPRCRQAFERHRLGRLHGSFLTRSAPQPTTARQPWFPGNPALCGSFLARAGPTRLQGRPKRLQCHLLAAAAERKFAHRASQSHAQTRSGTETPPHPKSQCPACPAPPGDGQNAALSLQANQSSARPTTDAYAGGAPHGSFLARSAPAFHRAALRFTLALASLDLGLCLGRPIDADDQTAQTTPAVAISFGSSTRTCRPDASGIVAAPMACTLCPDAEADQSRRPDHRLKEAEMHDRGPPQEQKLMRRPMPLLPVSTREDLVKNFFRAAHTTTSHRHHAVILQCSAPT